MPKAKASPLVRYRKRLKQRGNVRLEIQVPKDDVELVRGMARALIDPARREETRAVLKRGLSRQGALGLKALLAAAPLEGVDLERSSDTGREIDF